jgi:hypothetical protein
VYHRTAFQRADSNNVRISFDTPCFFIKESGGGRAFWDKLARPGHPTPFEHGILEVKTVGDVPPPWIDSLLATGWLTKGFLQSCLCWLLTDILFYLFLNFGSGQVQQVPDDHGHVLWRQVQNHSALDCRPQHGQ